MLPAQLTQADDPPVLAPNDEAFSDFVAENPSSANDSDFMEALIRYHIAHNTHPSAEFGLNPLFPATLLNSSQYTNVTGGQRIELQLQSNKPTILSGVKAPSTVITPDVFFQGGLIHIVSSVLTIPLSFPSTITRAKLTDLVALLNSGGWLSPSSPAISIVNDLSDLTVFGPNSPQFGAGFTGFDSLSTSELDAIFRYSIVQGVPPLYSSEFRNNTRHPTLQNGTAILFTSDPANPSTFYADAAQITTTDYLTSNGVLQVLSAPLNPATSGIGPSLAPPPPPPKDTGLSTPALVGLIIGILALLLGLALILALILRNRKRRGLSTSTTSIFGGIGKALKRDKMPEEDTPGIPRQVPSKRLASADAERGTARGGIAEEEGLELASAQPPRYGAHELDITGKQNFEDTTRGGRGGVSVVEIHNHHYGAGHYPHAHGDTPGPLPPHNGSLSDGSHSAGGTYAGSSPLGTTGTTGDSYSHVVYPITRAVDANGRTVTVYGGDGKPLPPKPPSPQEIDGEERSRISISISGERPRHLGFQARY